MTIKARGITAAAVLLLAVGTAHAATAPQQEQAGPASQQENGAPPHQHDHATAPPSDPAGTEPALDVLLQKMDDVTGEAKLAAMADVIRRLVAERSAAREPHAGAPAMCVMCESMKAAAPNGGPGAGCQMMNGK